MRRFARGALTITAGLRDEPPGTPNMWNGDLATLEDFLLSSQSGSHRGLGTFLGVFVPCTATTFGVVVFMRLGFVVGYAGVWLALLFVFGAFLLCLLTTLSLCALISSTDGCPNEPETMNGYLDTDGCPDSGPSGVEIARNQIVISEKILFETGRSTIKPVSHGILQAVAAVLADYPKTEVRVEGHTDSQGGASSNQRLSERRAKAVREHLIKQGVDGGRMSAKGYGEEKPIDTNRTRSGRANNRRVEFHITNAEDSGVR